MILSCVKWDTSSDVWCIACIILELYAGLKLWKNEKDIRRIILLNSEKRPRAFKHDREDLWSNSAVDGKSKPGEPSETLLIKREVTLEIAKW